MYNVYMFLLLKSLYICCPSLYNYCMLIKTAAKCNTDKYIDSDSVDKNF